MRMPITIPAIRAENRVNMILPSQFGNEDADHDTGHQSGKQGKHDFALTY
jgi:hypothetical protein